ncbi:MAG: AIR synthase [Desulfurococcales archaeon ex4484_58]|nr:MAG: AIR synthase [Desulfurococcales archaeon ex4484_58]
MSLGFKTGKLPWNILLELISILPTKDPDLVVGPAIGEDAAIIRFKDGFLVIHSDPITAASRRIGWLAVHIAANDIAVRGVKPKWFLPVIMLPNNFNKDDIRGVFEDLKKALEEVNGVVIGGHTEISPEISKPIISTTAIGYTMDRVILTRDAHPGDHVVVIGRIGGEGASIIAWDFEEKLRGKNIDQKIIDRTKKYIENISVVDKALTIKNYVNSMHDPTEGGILQGLRELALASNTGIILDLDQITIDENISTIVGSMGLDPLRILSSGALIATVPDNRLEDLIKILEEKNYQYSICGLVVKDNPGKVILKKQGKIVEVIDYDIIDEIYKLWRNIK